MAATVLRFPGGEGTSSHPCLRPTFLYIPGKFCTFSSREILSGPPGVLGYGDTPGGDNEQEHSWVFLGLQGARFTPRPCAGRVRQAAREPGNGSEVPRAAGTGSVFARQPLSQRAGRAPRGDFSYCARSRSIFLSTHHFTCATCEHRWD